MQCTEVVLKSPPSKIHPQLRDKDEMPTFDIAATTMDIKFMFGVEDSLAGNYHCVSVIWKFLQCKPYQSEFWESVP